MEHVKFQPMVAILTSPMTATQLARRLHENPEHCSRHLRRLMDVGVVECLNPLARSSRVYALTQVGQRCQKRLGVKTSPDVVLEATNFDWDLLGWVSYRHRSAVIKSMAAPMRAVTIRHRALQQNAQLRMSANNVRDVLRHFVDRRLARRVILADSIYPHFELTNLGRQLKSQLWNAEGVA
jgi:hypothetical protein